MMSRARRSAWGLALIATLLPIGVSAQTRSHGYLSLGSGATQLDAGGEWVIARGPIGVGVEVGAGNLLLGSITVAYHPLFRWPHDDGIDWFPSVSFTRVTDLHNEASGISVGGGMVDWFNRKYGLRIDGFAFLPAHDAISASSNRTSPHYWAIRFGFAFNLS